ncbi:MAG: tetraacyldisaccharide 4'-kinase [Myxococcales bacterium]|nr:tetraacyldisaccharide 4'-kinase [Myxococcales bacterium]
MNWPWRETEPEGVPLRAVLFPVAILSWGYGLLAFADRTRYLRGWKKRRRVDARVISVGSLVVGGSGKTPMASWLAERLHRRGHKVALLSRGYGGRPGGRPLGGHAEQSVTVVSDGQHVLTGPERTGDEPFMLAGQAAGVPVVVSQDRGVAALRAISAYGADVLILDDGFQHYRLQRDLDLVIFDAEFGAGNGHLLPRGPLRESLRGLQRADAIGEVDGALPEAITRAISRHAPEAFRFRAQRRPVSLRNLDATAVVSPDVLRGMKVGIIAGIARPESLRQTLCALGAEIVAERMFRDHHRYREQNFRGLTEQASVWITTEKDAVKMLPGWTAGVDLRVLAVRIAVAEDDALIDWIESRLDLGGAGRQSLLDD